MTKLDRTIQYLTLVGVLVTLAMVVPPKCGADEPDPSTSDSSDGK